MKNPKDTSVCGFIISLKCTFLHSVLLCFAHSDLVPYSQNGLTNDDPYFAFIFSKTWE